MTITFVDASRVQTETICVVIYGAPGTGKTSLALTADNPALLDFDRGVHRAQGREGKAALPITTWADVAGLSADDLKGYDTVIIDTVGTCLDKLGDEIIRRDPKMGQGGSLSLRGYGTLKFRFTQWLRMIRRAGKDVILIAHASEETKGEETVDRILAQGSSKNTVYQQADLIGKLAMTPQGRMLTFNPSAASYGKNVGLDDVAINGGGSLAEIIDQAKALINQKVEAQEAKTDEMAEARARWEEAIGDPVKVNLERAILTDAPGDVKRLFHQYVTSNGYTYEDNGYVREAEVAS